MQINEGYIPPIVGVVTDPQTRQIIVVWSQDQPQEKIYL
jgi:hypothetical protein